MDILRIRLTEEGGVRQFTPDFKVMRGSYGNILINIEVPKSLLIEPVVAEGQIVTGNNVRIGAIIRTATGHNLQTQRYEFARISDFTESDVEYRLYQRKMPKAFTAWETVNQLEATGSGILEMLINVINWSVDGEARVEEITASPTFTLTVYPSTYLENGEEIDDPSDFALLQSQVQDILELGLSDPIPTCRFFSGTTTTTEYPTIAETQPNASNEGGWYSGDPYYIHYIPRSIHGLTNAQLDSFLVRRGEGAEERYEAADAGWERMVNGDIRIRSSEPCVAEYRLTTNVID